MTKAVNDTARKGDVGDDARPSFDAIEIAATLNAAADRFGDAALVATILADALKALLREIPVDASPACRLAAEACIRVGHCAARDYRAAHEKFVLEAERYGH
ncbi:hypothetical protein G3N58_16150 [Paraburkholderia sp. Ac-20342]|uniref:hypothetical protein n=1 Tax=Paraburkholderia sp. Ac-20342 TaxID=2703889 RepID=UPI001980D851|nr:hypothetical protein [Paraburkholderia sp. Ac-20342]MBN3848350.1 hypothetical protein [Paraburkholderia sp. Ac-20342]